jgi:hypothetical protein
MDSVDKKIVQTVAQLRLNLKMAADERDRYKQLYGELNFLMIKILQGQEGREFRLDRKSVEKTLDPAIYKVMVANDMKANELVIKLVGIDDDIVEGDVDDDTLHGGE